MPSTGRRQTRPRPCFSPGGHGENACLLRRCSPRSWSQPAPSVTMIPVVWPGWEIPWGSDLVVGAVEPSPSPGRSPAGQLGPPASGGGGSLLPLLHVPSVGVIACQPGEAAIPPRAVPSGARRSRKAGGQGGGHPLLLAVSAPLQAPSFADPGKAWSRAWAVPLPSSLVQMMESAGQEAGLRALLRRQLFCLLSLDKADS